MHFPLALAACPFLAMCPFSVQDVPPHLLRPPLQLRYQRRLPQNPDGAVRAARWFAFQRHASPAARSQMDGISQGLGPSQFLSLASLCSSRLPDSPLVFLTILY